MNMKHDYIMAITKDNDMIREIVKEAYEEGFILGRRVGQCIRAQRSPLEAWLDSYARKSLEEK